MQFSYSLQFNAVPEWADDYLSYGELKKTIRDMETVRLEEAKGLSPSAGVVPSGSVALELGPKSVQMENEFLAKFTEDCRRVAGSFAVKKEESSRKLRELFSAVTSDSSSDVAVNRIEVWTGEEESLEKRRATLEDRFNSAYLGLHDLHDFLDLNYTGYVKLVKNYSKYAAASLENKRALLAKVDAILPIAELSELQSKMGQVEEVFGRVMCDGNVMQARAVLHLLLRDRVASARQSISPSAAGSDIVKTAILAADPEIASVPIAKAPVAHGHGHGKYFTPYRIGSMIASVFCLFGFLYMPNAWLGGLAASPESKNCLAILMTCTLLWCTEAIPLYATALLVPFLISVLKAIALKDLNLHDGDKYSAYTVAKYIFANMHSDMIVLLLGGFSIAAAFQKYGITKKVALVMLKKFGGTPSSTLLTIMMITMAASLFVSNVAAPVLCFGLIQPIIRNLDCTSPLAQSLILGIAFAANIGGLGSTIASPQSAIGFKELDGRITFVNWLFVSMPIALCTTVACWMWLRFTFPSRETLNLKEIFAVRAGEKPANPVKVAMTLSIAAFTLGLWICSSKIQDNAGSLGCLAVVGIVGLFGTGLLGKEDFNGFMWNVVMLAMGGTALAKALASSGLLDAMGLILNGWFGKLGFWGCLFSFCSILLFVTTFISHSVGAMIFLPIIRNFATTTFGTGPEQAALVLAACFTCSAGMAMPISGFPNMTAVSQEDRNGRPYVSTKEFAKGGIVPSVIFVGFIIVFVGTIGQWAMSNAAPFDPTH
jgi:phosphate transporter